MKVCITTLFSFVSRQITDEPLSFASCFSIWRHLLTFWSNGCPAYQLLCVILQYFFSVQTKFLAYIFDVWLSVQDKGIVFFTNFYYIWNAPIILAVLITTKTLTNIEKKLSDSFNSLVRTSQHLNKGKTSIATFSKLWFWQQFIKRQIHYRLHIHVRNGCWLLVF